MKLNLKLAHPPQSAGPGRPIETPAGLRLSALRGGPGLLRRGALRLGAGPPPQGMKSDSGPRIMITVTVTEELKILLCGAQDVEPCVSDS